MKKLLYILFFATIAVQLFASTASAATLEEERNRGLDDYFDDPAAIMDEMRDNPYADQNVATFDSALDILEAAIYWMLGFVAIIAVLFLIIGGYYYVTAHGDEGQTEKGKKIVIGAVIGLIIIVASYTIVATILNFGAIQENTSGTAAVTTDLYSNLA